MSRILTVLTVILSISSACAGSITHPLEGWLYETWHLEGDWDYSLSVVNLGGGRIVQRSLQGPAYLHWWSPAADWVWGYGFQNPDEAVESWFAPTLAEWKDLVAWRITLPLSGARVVATETVRSDDFAVDASDNQELLSLLVWTNIEWHLHPLDWRYPLPGEARGRSTLEYRVYWRQGQQLPVMLYSFAWDSRWIEGYDLSLGERIYLPVWEDLTFECDEEDNCWVVDETYRAQGVLWWERTMRMELSYIPDVPEPGSHWLVLAGLAAILAGREFRRRMR